MAFKFHWALVLVLVAPTMAQADAPMTAAEFQAYTTGKTLTYASTGDPYGAEEYLNDRRVLWTYFDGECFHGRWFAQGSKICFVYETWTAPQCWHFFESGVGLTATYVGEEPSAPIYELKAAPEPLNCPGPLVGS